MFVPGSARLPDEASWDGVSTTVLWREKLPCTHSLLPGERGYLYELVPPGEGNTGECTSAARGPRLRAGLLASCSVLSLQGAGGEVWPFQGYFLKSRVTKGQAAPPNRAGGPSAPRSAVCRVTPASARP